MMCPVTHTADVAVNSASRKSPWLASVRVKGNMSSPVPIRIVTANADAMSCAGFRVRRSVGLPRLGDFRTRTCQHYAVPRTMFSKCPRHMRCIESHHPCDSEESQ